MRHGHDRRMPRIAPGVHTPSGLNRCRTYWRRRAGATCTAGVGAAALRGVPVVTTCVAMTHPRRDSDDHPQAKAKRIIHRRFARLEGWLPARLAGWVAQMRRPSASWVRIPVALGLIAGGFLAVLPGLGVWMLPLGILLLALDIAVLRRPTAAAVVGGERRWRKLLRRWRRRD